MKNQETLPLLTEDEQRLEEITSAFVRGVLMAGRFDDKKKYIELSRRIASIIDLEIKDEANGEIRRLWLQFWGPHAN